MREAGEKRWGHCFHVPTKEEAEGLRDLLNSRQITESPEQVRDRYNTGSELYLSRLESPEMVEVVAVAMHDAMPPIKSVEKRAFETWEETNDFYKEMMRTKSKAALQAIRKAEGL